MRLQLTITHRDASAPGTDGLSVVDVEVDAPTGSTAGALVAALADHLGLDVTRDKALTLAAGGVVVQPDALVGLPPLLDGAALAVHPRPSLPDNGIRPHVPARSPVVLAVLHGPDCGRVVDLGPGRHTIGRSQDADIRIDDPRLSRRHTEICVEADGVTLRDLGSTNGTRVDEEPLGDEPVPVTTASVIHLGDTMVALRRAGSIPAATTATGEGTLAVNRRPRVLERHPPPTITLPKAPQQPRRTRIPWPAVLLPVPVAAVLAVVVGPTMLAFALMGPVLMAGTALGDRWGARRSYAADLLEHDAELRAATGCIEAACRDEIRELARSFPGPATVLGIASGPTERLWERRRGDDDAFVVTIGRCRQDASLRLVRQSASRAPEQQPQLHDAPCTVSLKEVGVLGLCGERSALVASARWLVGQLVTMHSPADLGVVCLLGTDEVRSEWLWLGRVPHRHDDHGGRTGPTVHVLGSHETAVRTIVSGLATTIRERLAQHDGSPWSGPTTLVVVDGARALRTVPGLATVLADGPRVGVVCLTLGADRRELPHEAGAVLHLAANGPPTLSLPGHRHDDLVADGVGFAWSERLSRSLAPLRDATPSEGPAALPAAIGLLGCGSPLDGVATDPGTERLPGRALAEAWLRHPHSTRVSLGICSTGTFTVDLARDGPHILVGGTTGAGKSELLRTLVASLALRNTPQHLSFVLVDYKGGAAFRDCAELPHVAGVVTDLDDHLAARALTSLTAELTRRERLLKDAGSTDFVSYQTSSAGVKAPLARLVVVVDEFRALAEELPTFVDGLVHLAALGRSLGIHLVLATQRPAGVVTADIKANVNLRIALRMRDRIDSEDVVDSPAAAALDPTTPGRAHARVGGSPLVEFQSAHVGAPLVGPGTQSIRVRPSTPGSSTAWPDDAAGQECTELAVIVDAVRRASTIARHEPAPAAWLPPLPPRVPHAALDEPPDAFTVHLGLVDVPQQQRRGSLAFDLRERGHWAVVGSPGSGRTTTLLTAALSLCRKRGPDSLHVYAVSGGGLTALESLPQVGAEINWTDTRRVERLVSRLSAEVAERRAALVRHGSTTLVDWWNSADSDDAPPPILLLVDDWDLVAGRHDDLALSALVDRLLVLLREGEAVGLTALLAGDRSLVLGRAGAAVGNRLVLRLADPADAVLLGLATRQLAALHVPGRGVTMRGDQVQLALPPELPQSSPVSDPTSAARGEPLAVPGGHRPLRVAALPPVVHDDELFLPPRRAGTLALGIGGDDSTVLGLDPGRDGRRWLVTGSTGSGVSTTLLRIGRSLAASGQPLAVVSHRAGPLDLLRRDPAVVAWCEGTTPAPLVDARRRTPSLAVLVDTADELLDHPLEAVLREIAHVVDRDGGLLVVGANATALSSMYRGLAVEVARHRTGVLLGPASRAEAEVLGARAPVDRGSGPGRGHVVQRGASTPVQVALPTAAPDPLAVARYAQ